MATARPLAIIDELLSTVDYMRISSATSLLVQGSAFRVETARRTCRARTMKDPDA